MHLLPLKKDGGKKTILAFDIGSSSVGGALILVDPGSKPKVLYTSRRLMRFQKELNFDRFTKYMLEALESVSVDLEKNAMSHLTFNKNKRKKIDRILCSYASPWYVSEVKTISMKRDKAFELTEDVVRELIHEEEREVAKSDKEEEAEKAGTKVNSVDKYVIDVRLGGYRVPEPYGRKTHEVSVTTALIMLSVDLQQKIDSSLRRHFEVEEIRHHALSLIGVLALQESKNTPSDYLLIDVSGEVTDVSMVKDNVLLETTSFPLGKHFVIRKLAKLMSISINEAASALEVYLEGGSDEGRTLDIEGHMKTVQNSWGKSFDQALLKFQNEVVIPHKVFLLSDTKYAGLFKKFITEDKPREDMFTSAPFEVKRLSGNELRDHVVFRGGTARDPFLSIAAVYFNRGTSLV